MERLEINDNSTNIDNFNNANNVNIVSSVNNVEEVKRKCGTTFFYNFYFYYKELLLLVSGLLSCLLSFLDKLKDYKLLSWFLFIFGFFLFLCGIIKIIKKPMIDIFSFLKIYVNFNNELYISNSDVQREFNRTLLYFLQYKRNFKKEMEKKEKKEKMKKVETNIIL